MKISKQQVLLTASFLLLSAILAGCSLNTPTKSALPTQTEQTEKPKAEELQINGDISYSTPSEKDIWTPEFKQKFMEGYKKMYPDSEVKTFEDTQKYGYYKFFEVGTITKTPYKNQKLLVIAIPCDGMCFTKDTYRFAYDETTKTLTLLKKHSINSDSYLPVLQAISTKTDSVTNLENLDAPDKILIPGTDKYAELETKDASDMFDSATYNPIEQYSEEYTDKPTGMKIYYNLKSTKEFISDECLRVLLPDGTISIYAFKPDFGKAITDKYSMTAGGCGITGSCYLIADVQDSDLIPARNKSGNIDFYVPKNPKTDKILLDNYDRYKILQEWKVKENPSVKVLSLDEFVTGEPLLYWKDPLGRWSSLINNDIKPMAECGKPVIYLYPQKTMDVSVEVGIDRLTKTIPEYKTGWKVSAQPNGTLYNYDDKQAYPYLFWEGQNKGMLTPTKGSSVKRADLEKFLTDSLDSLGLNRTEKKDFMEFWLSKMLANNEEYFFVSFVGTRDFNKVAPLKISPAPDTLIRVFMYYMPLDKPMRTEKQDLKAIDRNGFTVVEWGGTSSVPWLE